MAYTNTGTFELPFLHTRAEAINSEHRNHWLQVSLKEAQRLARVDALISGSTISPVEVNGITFQPRSRLRQAWIRKQIYTIHYVAFPDFFLLSSMCLVVRLQLHILTEDWISL